MRWKFWKRKKWEEINNITFSVPPGKYKATTVVKYNKSKINSSIVIAPSLNSEPEIDFLKFQTRFKEVIDSYIPVQYAVDTQAISERFTTIFVKKIKQAKIDELKRLDDEDHIGCFLTEKGVLYIHDRLEELEADK